MNILVTGANGQLGNSVRVAAKQSKHNYIYTDVAELDITNAIAVKSFVENSDIDVIINCAAYTNVEKAETDADTAMLLNAEAPAILANALKDKNGLLVHISTDYVFGGGDGNLPKTEDEPINPTGVYGVTKLRGEELIKSSSCRYIIFRTAWLYSEYGNNFVKTMLRLTAEKESLKVVFDQVGTPTYAPDLARTIVDLLETKPLEALSGIYHYSNEGVCSWYDFTKSIAEMSGNTSCEIQPCHSDEFPSSVIRPPYSVLDKTKLKKDFNLTVPYWRDSLSICINNLIHNK
jgi:dTDP-4-dehydrorhamnose reductase